MWYRHWLSCCGHLHDIVANAVGFPTVVSVGTVVAMYLQQLSSSVFIAVVYSLYKFDPIVYILARMQLYIM